MVMPCHRSSFKMRETKVDSVCFKMKKMRIECASFRMKGGNQKGNQWEINPGPKLLQDEPDEVSQESDGPTLFGQEPDECSGGSASDDSAYMGDCENTKGSRDDFAIVNLNFGTLSKFLSSQLKAATSTPSVGSQPKKRRYNNETRLRAAAAKKEGKQPGRTRNPRNSLESHYWIVNCIGCVFSFP